MYAVKQLNLCLKFLNAELTFIEHFFSYIVSHIDFL